MNKRAGIWVAIGLLLSPASAFADEAKVVLAVHHAGCVLCGPIVKRTLSQVSVAFWLEPAGGESMVY